MNSIYIVKVLLYCTVLNYSILLVWFLAFVVARDKLYTLHTRWFRMTPEQFNIIHYAGIALYKLGIILFNIVPLTAFWLMT